MLGLTLLEARVLGEIIDGESDDAVEQCTDEEVEVIERLFLRGLTYAAPYDEDNLINLATPLGRLAHQVHMAMSTVVADRS